ncbi:phosphatase PAP2 family protein [Nocardia sp. BMG51109]|uniref:phosphatase PAP2 family protein n=1 Tax=Nocardia sp. BMG51109 TaxID=1056816 RepID=UPI00046713D7|nr:phosphatase PAP2 family protein [Nocardia sp. BMG51109]
MTIIDRIHLRTRGFSALQYCHPLRYGWLALGGVVATGAAVWVVRTGVLDGTDRSLFRWFNSAPDGLYRPLWAMQLIGVLGAPLVVAVGAATARRYRLAAAMMLLPLVKLAVEFDILKQLVWHPRPGAAISGAVLRDVPLAGPAFPSGHAIILFGMATLLCPYLGIRWCSVVFGAVTAAVLVRVYLGAHTPLDVLGGAAAGLTVGAALNLVVGVPGTGAGAGSPIGHAETRPKTLPARGTRWHRAGESRKGRT